MQDELDLRKQILAILADMLYSASDVFKRAIDAIIAYGTEKYKSIFGNDEAADIKNVMRSYGDTKEQHQAIGTWLCDYADSRQSFDEIKIGRLTKRLPMLLMERMIGKLNEDNVELVYNTQNETKLFIK